MTSTVTPTTAATANNASTTFQVQLAIYDLSNGIAKALSAQLLGPQHSIEIVPHTSILAFGKEYYFGATGVEQTDPHHFRSTRQLFPIQIQDLGHTTVSQEEFERWCKTHVENGLYASHSYDLFVRNCNNFSHHAATEGLRLKQAVPEWILDVPRRVLASPMGPLIRPMLEQMQIAPSGDDGYDTGSSTTASSSSISSSTLWTAANRTGDCNSTTKDNDILMSMNPWDNLPKVCPKTDNSSNDVSSNGKEQSTSISNDVTTSTKRRSELNPPVNKDAAPLLDSYSRPLLSQDNQMIQQCTNKLKHCSFVVGNRGSCTCLNETQRERFLEYLNHIPQILKGHKSASADPADSTVCSTTQPNNKVSFVDMKELLTLLNKISNDDNDDVSDIERTFALMLVRLLVLEKDIVDSDAFVETASVMKELITNKATRGASTRAMAWCVLGNIVGMNHAVLLDGHFLDNFVDCAMLDVSTARENSVNVRRGASAFLYNLVLVMRNDNENVPVSDLNVKLLCEIMEAVPYEEDEVAATRMLLTVGKIIKHGNDVNAAATSLLKELGYRSSLVALGRRENFFQGDEFCRLASEIVQLL